jgi:hypothetical protein
MDKKAEIAHDTEYYRLLQELQEIDFVLVELTLYLDTHPNDAAALRQFNEFAMKKHQVRAEFERRYGPMLQFGNSFSAYPWQWWQPPWPWQV